MLYRVLYYGFARFLPKSTAPVLGKLSMRIRRVICRHMFRRAVVKKDVPDWAFVGGNPAKVIRLRRNDD